MSEKIIDEVMGLIDVYVFDSEENALYIDSGVDSEVGLALLKQKRNSRSAIRAKLREVLEIERLDALEEAAKTAELNFDKDSARHIRLLKINIGAKQ